MTATADSGRRRPPAARPGAPGRMVAWWHPVCLAPPVPDMPAHWRAATPMCDNWVDGPP
jgi:hypothetical protein